MPWKVEEREGQYCVVVAEGPKKGSTVKCHPDEKAAQAQVKALYANTGEESKPKGPGPAIGKLKEKLPPY